MTVVPDSSDSQRDTSIQRLYEKQFEAKIKEIEDSIPGKDILPNFKHTPPTPEKYVDIEGTPKHIDKVVNNLNNFNNLNISKKEISGKKFRVKNWLYFIVLIIAALGLAGTAAYFSVFGLSKIFAGASMAAIIMAASIELGKIVAVSFSNRYWKQLGVLKGYLLTAIIIAMIVTSASIYGFLSSAYQMTADKLSIAETRIKIEDTRKGLIVEQVSAKREQITVKNNRIKALTDTRMNQEVRLDSLYSIRYFTTARRTEIIIQRADMEISRLTSDIGVLSMEISSLCDSIFVYEERVLNLRNTDETTELGPLRFTAELLNVEMDKVVVVFIIMLILIFDPMAMALIIAINRLVVISKNGI